MGFMSRAHFPAALQAVLTSNLIIKLGCNIKQALLDVAVTYDDPEIRLSLRSNPPILELSQHAKLKGFVREGSASLHALVGKVLPLRHGTLLAMLSNSILILRQFGRCTSA